LAVSVVAWHSVQTTLGWNAGYVVLTTTSFGPLLKAILPMFFALRA
jgi:hypothetical protein